MQARTRPGQAGQVRRLAAALVSVSLLAMGACDARPGGEDVAPVVDASSIAATVNGEPIYASDVQLEAETQGLAQPGDMLDNDSAEFHAILDELIDIKLLALEAEARGLEDDPRVRHRLETARDHILGNSLMDVIVSERVDEAAVRKMYEAQVAAQEEAGQLGEEARVRHIMTDSKEAIERIAADLKTGADFSVLASQQSSDEATKMDGGDLGFLSDTEAARLSPELAQAVKATPTGAVSRPFQSGIGWHVIRVDERRKEQPPSIDDLREPILKFMRTEQIDETLKQLRSEARIDRQGAPRDAPLDTDPFRLAPTEADPGPARPPRPAPSIEASAQGAPPSGQAGGQQAEGQAAEQGTPPAPTGRGGPASARAPAPGPNP
jgi:peptidyl-prolyl cis-trans isomerase C